MTDDTSNAAQVMLLCLLLVVAGIRQLFANGWRRQCARRPPLTRIGYPTNWSMHYDRDLDGLTASIGQTSVLADGGQFRIDSFFDVFVELSLDSVPPLHTTRGPIHFSLAPGPSSVPEPASLALIGISLAGIGFSRRKQ